MLSFIQNFTDEERDYFWRPFPEPTTVCRMTFSLRDMFNYDKLIQISCNSVTSKDHIHAEVIAYNSIKEELFTCLPKQNNLQLLDFIIALNNSPCSDCREKILNWINDIQRLMPNTSIRLILFFSSLYKYNRKKPVPTVLGPFIKWILDIVGNHFVVIICPIVVFKMLPDFDYRFEELLSVVKADKRIIEIFRKLLKELKSQLSPQNNSFSVFPSHKFFNQDSSVHLRLFTWENPKYISIVPRNKDHLWKLFLKLPLTEVAERISPKSKKDSKSHFPKCNSNKSQFSKSNSNKSQFSKSNSNKSQFSKSNSNKSHFSKSNSNKSQFSKSDYNQILQTRSNFYKSMRKNCFGRNKNYLRGNQLKFISKSKLIELKKSLM